ncbi:MAG: hypothetical protein NTW86_12355 [Candidatus Sumerlaeota bacterium]|nr:hypothetical protein [Candidatus Sumerlaeota bacterium]
MEKNGMNRRGVPRRSAVGAAASASAMLSVDYRKLVSRADIRLNKPVDHSEQGMPIGNGRMSSLVWTDPAAMRLQINRVDLFPRNTYSGSGPGKRLAKTGILRRVYDNDYHGGAGRVAIRFGGDVFTDGGTRQHLSLYDAQHTLEGQGLKARVLAWHARDVMAIEVQDRRENPSAIQIDLSMLRPAVVTTGKHTATSKVRAMNGRIVLTQVFKEPAWTGIREGDFYCGSAVVIGVIGRRAEAGIPNESTARLAVAPGKGTCTILIGSTASFERQQDVIREAVSHIEAAEEKGYGGLFAENQAWWHEFWSRSFIYLRSPDRVAEGVEQFYRSYLYVLGSSSRGRYPPSSINHWSTDDKQAWGADFCWNQQRTLYRTPMQANHMELMEPLFDLYSEMYEAQAVSARQCWGSKGIYLSEHALPGGMQRLPDNLASELQDILYERKRWEERSPEFDDLTKHVNATQYLWDWLPYNEFYGPYGPAFTIFAHSARQAELYWLKYEYTLDENWLRTRAYPMLKGVAEFYRNHPKVKKEKDGKYHIHNVQNHETMGGAQDTMEEQTAMRGVMWRVILASKILKVDSEMRPVWQEFLDNLAPLPMVDQPNAVYHAPGVRAWASGIKPYRYIRYREEREGGPTLRPAMDFDLWTLETEDSDLTQIVYTTYERMPQIKTFRKAGRLFEMIEAPNPAGWPPLPLEFAGGGGPAFPELSEMPTAAAMLGLAADIKKMLPLQTVKYPRFMVNRMAYDEGYQTQSVQMSGNVSGALQLALMQSIPTGPGQPPVIRVFPAWPREWDASFQLLARRGFLVTSSMRKGNIEFVEILSQLGGECRLRNPWQDTAVTVYRKGKKAEDLNESLLKIGSSLGESILVVPRGSKLERFRRKLPSPAPQAQ